jgi:hypothetical protein
MGTHLQSIWPTIVEVVGHTRRFDYIEFSGEYAPYDLHGLDDFCRAAELHGLGAMIKLDQEPRTWLAQRAIGAGFQSAPSGRTPRPAAGRTGPPIAATASGARRQPPATSRPWRRSWSWR